MKILWNFINKNTVQVSIIVVALLIFSTVVISFSINETMKENYEMSKEIDLVLDKNQQIGRDFNLYDIGVRGYALTKDKKLLEPYYIGLRGMQSQIDTSRLMITKHGLSPAKLDAFTAEIKKYEEFCEYLIVLVQKDSVEAIRKLLIEDHGYKVWKVYERYFTEMIQYETNMKIQANDKYNSSIRINSLFHFLLVLVGIPASLLILFKLKRQEHHRYMLVKNLQDNNRQYLFNPGFQIDNAQSEKVVEESMDNIKAASEFIHEIGKGNFNIQWPGLTKENKELNKETLAAALVEMRDKMKNVKEEDEKRMWATEGIAKFSEIIRNQQSNMHTLCDEAIKFMVKYMKAQQGGIYIIRGNNVEEQYLELSACYAFERKKFLQKRIEIGEGLIGQNYLEGVTTKLTNIPDNYLTITSGLGEASPKCILIVPMKYNESIEAIVELAGFTFWEDYQVSFLERCGEFLSSILSSVKITEKTHILLQQSQVQAEQLRLQEEELRQNMEELAATNEEMKRKEEEALKILLRENSDIEN